MSLRSIHALTFLLALAAGGIAAPRDAFADEPAPTSAMAKPMSPEMRAIDVDERRYDKLDGNLAFTDHEGNLVHARDWFDGERPVLLTLNYYHCRVVCSVQLGGLATALADLSWTPGDEHFRVVTISLDARETAKDAAFKRTQILDELGRGPDVDWQFLRGDALSIQTLAAQLGISYAYDAEQDQFAHPAVAVFLMPDGTIAQYLYGLTYESRDIKFALMEAGQGRIGSPMEKLYQSCFTYDHTIGRYGPWAFGFMRIGATICFLILATTLAIFWRYERRKRRGSAAPGDTLAETVS
jgi:protein SCO1/2